ncbi:MAG: nucleotidyl transferase AbiEii/AbiGii toxin family protein [Gemmatimonadota bacterium]
MLSDVAAREAFHVLLLEFLLKRIPTGLVLKGGVNLRLFFGSPRYSQDIDFDAEPRLRDAVRSAIRSGLKDPHLRQHFVDLGGADIRATETPQKNTETTLRFKFGVVSGGGVDLPTKVEVSFRPRPALDVADEDAAPAGLVDRFRLPLPSLDAASRRRGRDRRTDASARGADTPGPSHGALIVRHYRRLAALRQKVGALALRNEVQARDVFDLGVLDAAAMSAAEAARLREALPDSVLQKAAARAFEIPYEAYEDKVLAFLDPTDRARYAPPNQWDEQCLFAHELAQQLLALPGPAWVPWYPDEAKPASTL